MPSELDHFMFQGSPTHHSVAAERSKPSGQLPTGVSRRHFLTQARTCAFTAATALAGIGLAARQVLAEQKREPDERLTDFQIACMTLPYSKFPFGRAIRGIKQAGYRWVSLGTTHIEAGSERVPVIAADAPTTKARDVAQQCRDQGLEPLMMFSMIYPERPGALEVLTHRLKQASFAQIPQVLTFGHTEGGNRKVWIERFRKLGPIAQDLNVTLVVKQHGGSTGTGKACAEIVREVDDPGVMVNYDAGNVMDYLNVDPIPDIEACADVVRSFCIKDHRNWPRDQDCGPGLGEIDHYRLLSPVARRGIPMPLCCENIFAPLLPRPQAPEGVDQLARRAREYLELVIRGLAQT